MERKDFNRDLPQTKAYAIYRRIEQNYEREIDGLSSKECNLLAQQFNNLGIKLNIVSPKIQSFKNAFKHKVKLYLDDLIKRFGIVASLWFDEKKEYDLRKNPAISTGLEPDGLGNEPIFEVILNDHD